MTDIFTYIILPLLLLFVPASIGFYKWKVERKDKLSLQKENDALKQEVEDLSEVVRLDFEMFNDIKDSVDMIFEKTKADRFLILTGTNGKTNLRFVSVIYEHHKKNNKISLSIGAVNKYVKFEFDDSYRRMLKQIEATGCINYDVKLMEDGDLKRIYENEEVNFSNVFFLCRIPMDSENDRLFFCSISTHSDEPYTDNEFVIMKIATSNIKNSIDKNIRL